ncbi:MAG: hypothetical protein A2V70_08480 [Planctomycetes bacterium RBG_13_63_9]|nr:MAG: hypothetical protein A2V70_08480 [Planctomycetes bacterium RBG_13_63_9]
MPALWVLFGWIPIKWFDYGFPATAGEFGDSFGFANSFFSSLALGFVIVALILQTFELGLQRQEMKESRQVWERTSKAEEEASAALKREADATLVAAYLDGLIALQRLPAEEEVPVYQFLLREQVADVTLALAPKINKILGDRVGGMTRELVLHKRLKTLVRTFETQWEAAQSTYPDWRARAQELLRDLRRNYEPLTTEIAQDNEMSKLAEDILEKIDSLLTIAQPSGGTRPEIDAKLKQLGREGKDLTCAIRTLAQQYCELHKTREEAAKELMRASGHQ